MSTVDQKRIATNTALLYVRMLFIMLISLYTSRVILRTLGEVDFGLYNVVGGIVISFSFLNGVMSSACSRYFAIEIGRQNDKALKHIFSLNLTLFFCLSFIILLLSETVGLWFLNNKMNIPPERVAAVQWVYQCSVISFLINMISTPYRAIIIAREKMKVFAYSSIVEAILKLLIVYILLIGTIDKLILYAILMLTISAGTSGFYYAYCRYYYKECNYHFIWDYKLIKEVLGYNGWNIIGNLAFIGKSQGINILLNMFFTPAINAARGIAYQVYTSINQFVTNFMMATNPQITKAYSQGLHQDMMKLVFQSSKFSYFLLFILILPIYLQLPLVLDIWLKEVPEYTTIFTRLILINALIDSLGMPIITSMQATGRIKEYQIYVGSTLLMIIPVAYILLNFFHFPPTSVFYISILFSFIAQIIRIWFMNHYLTFPIKEYIQKVLYPILLVTITAVIPSLASLYYFANRWINFFVTCSIAVITTGLAIYFLGLTHSERDRIRGFVTKRITLLIHKK